MLELAFNVSNDDHRPRTVILPIFPFQRLHVGFLAPYPSHIAIAALAHLGRVTHICVNKLIGSDNGLSPGRPREKCLINHEPSFLVMSRMSRFQQRFHQTGIEIKTWVSNYITNKLWDVIAYTCCIQWFLVAAMFVAAKDLGGLDIVINNAGVGVEVGEERCFQINMVRRILNSLAPGKFE